MGIESFRPKKLTPETVASPEPVHGLGIERMSEPERKDFEALLARLGSAMDDPVLASAPQEILLDAVTYVRSNPGSGERAAAAANI